MRWGGNLGGNGRPSDTADSDPNTRYVFGRSGSADSAVIGTILGYKICDVDGPNYRCRWGTPSEGNNGGVVAVVFPEFCAPGWTPAQVKNANAGIQQFLNGLKSSDASPEEAAQQRVQFTLEAAKRMVQFGPDNALDLLVAYAEVQRNNPQGQFDYDTAVAARDKLGSTSGSGVNMTDYAMQNNTSAGSSAPPGGAQQSYDTQGTASGTAPGQITQTSFAETESSGMSMTTKVVIAVGALAVVGVVVALVMKKRKVV